MPIGKALWYIESHLGDPLRLEAVAQSVGLSRFHLSRAFGAATGYSVMGYARARRLTEAARRLSQGEDDILSVALEFGYGSHEAFTRAFREQFGITPETLRGGSALETLNLLEPMMTQTQPSAIAPQRYVDAPAMHFAGLARRYSFSQIAQIPQLWAQFGPHIGHVPGEVQGVAWGVCYDTVMDGDGFDYLASVEVGAGAEIGPELSSHSCPALHYAVFAHTTHVSDMNRTMQAIWAWLPGSGKTHAEPGLILERYGPEFNGQTGMGGMEIWVPVKR